MLVRFYKSKDSRIARRCLRRSDKRKVKKSPNLLINPSFIASRRLLKLCKSRKFVLSHKENLAAIICGTSREIRHSGIDIEKLKARDFKSVIDFCFDECERRFYENSSDKLLTFYKIYTAKEAMIKAQNLEFASLLDVSFFDKRFCRRYFFKDDFIICVVTRAESTKIRF